MIVSFLVKIISLPIVLFLSTVLLTQVQLSSIGQTIIVILVLAITGITMEKFLVTEKTFWLSVLADFIATVGLLWLLSSFFDGIAIALGAAVIISIIVAIQEYFVHVYLLAEKS